MEQIAVPVPDLQLSIFRLGFHERGSQAANFLRFGDPLTGRFGVPSVARYVLPRDHEGCHGHPRDSSP